MMMLKLSQELRGGQFRVLFALLTVLFFVGVSNGQGSSGGGYEYSAEVKQMAIDQLLASARGKDPYLRANAIEASQVLVDRSQPMVQLGLNDDEAVVRFTALVTAGQGKMKGLVSSIRMLLIDPNQSVQAAAMFAMHQCGEKVDLTPMAGMVMGVDPYLRSNVVMLLGQMGDASAIPLIKQAMRVRMPASVKPQQVAITKVQAAEALVRLGDRKNLDSIRAVAVSMTSDEARVLAVRMLGRLGDRKMTGALKPMVDQRPIELQLAASETLAILGMPQAVDVVLHATKSANSAVRAQAAIVLGSFGQLEAKLASERMLRNDSSEQVRLAAAAGILGYRAKQGGLGS